jgi:hypothetical protein
LVPYGFDDKLLSAADTILQTVFPMYKKASTFKKNASSSSSKKYTSTTTTK